MAYLTIGIAGTPEAAYVAAVETVARRRGATVTWRSNPAAARSYALIETPEPLDPSELPVPAGGVAYDRAIIAWAVFPSVPEALPALADAFGGGGRPAGVLACRPCAGGLVVEWDPQRCGAELILQLADVELARFDSGRTAALLSPLPPAVLAGLAARGLQAPQIAPSRILELLIAL